jgi:hypothetical protein
MWFWSSSIGKEYNSSQVYCQAKGWFQKSQAFSNDLEKGFGSGKMEGEKMDSHEKVLKNVFSSQNIEFTFFKRETFGAFLPFSFFYASFSLFFSMLRLFIENELGVFRNV